ncbi:proline and serine-rich protein 3 isoform X2 [Denticeps clupeoides]|uniref:proline and serine-rich protein 3 isoform X2 n=1 Tax=Denticeps clupeoides TaxID=299321 RepID=UPI0010A40EBD|nr:proline and serine-rich protein 3 isoform X2 [Denticeps clupeoides]
MKSSAVFTRQNPFPPEPPFPRTHYSPSRIRTTSKQQRALTNTLRSNPPQANKKRVVGEGPQTIGVCPKLAEDQASFFESWPSSEVTSPASPHTDAQAEDRQTTKSQAFSEMDEHEESVLAKYIERFRCGRPQSREERQSEAAAGQRSEFWWMSSDSPEPSSTITRQNIPEGINTDNLHAQNSQDCATPLSTSRDIFDFSVLGLSDSSHCEAVEHEVLQLQDRASHLLKMSECSLSSSSVPISSGGLGCSDHSSTISMDEPVRRPVMVSLLHSTSGTSAPCSRPEDDILFQWRLRRKMEQANERLHTQPLHDPPRRLIGQATRGLFSTGSPCTVTPSFTPAPLESTTPYSPACVCLHHPVSSPTVCQLHTEAPAPSYHTQPLKESQQKLSQKTHKALTSGAETAEGLSSRHDFAPPPQELSESTDEDQTIRKREQKSGKKGGLQRKDKESTQKGNRQGVASSQRRVRSSQAERGVRKPSGGPQQVTQWNEPCRKRVESVHQGSGQEGRPGDQAPPPSPIHTVVGQVVSKVLFPHSDTQSTSRTPCHSSQGTSPAPPQSPTLLPSMQQPSEVIAQLLQDAEDSDGLEFENDPLLKILRHQRKWVKEQISELDSLLDDLQD